MTRSWIANHFGREPASRHWPWWARHALAALLVIVALLFQTSLWEGGYRFPLILFYPVILLSTVLLGLLPGLLAVLLSAMAAAFWLVPVGGVPAAEQRVSVVALMIFAGVGTLSVCILAALRQVVRELGELNRKLARTEEQKDLLLREAAHRFRNDLATVAALLRLQEREVKDPQAKEALLATCDRIAVMTRVQERLQRLDGIEAIVQSDAFVRELCDDLRASLIGQRPVRLDAEAERHALPQDRAVAIGLIINELVTNALKYAFPDERSGSVQVKFWRENENLCLEVRDNGVGILPERASKGTGLGQRLVRSFASQIDGTFTIRPDDGEPGTIAQICFPIEARS